MFAYAYTFIAAFLVTLLLTPPVKKLAVAFGAVDRPDARKVHHGLVPRLGGLAIFAGFIVSVALTVGFDDPGMCGLCVGAAFLVLVGILDDRYSLPPKVKLLDRSLRRRFLSWGSGFA